MLRLNRLCLYLTLFTISSALVQALPAPDPSGPSGDKAAQALVRLAVANEISAGNKGPTKVMYLSRKRSSQGFETKLNVETTQATAAMLIETNNQPISDQQMRDETERLDKLSSNPRELRRKQRQEQEDADHTLRIMKAFPDAFLYQFDGTEAGTSSLGKTGDELVHLKFRPNPAYAPPSHVEQVLAGMQGELVIDKQAHRIARIDATLFKEVSFGWGILGHLDKGGSFLVEQAEVAPNDWELTRTRLSFTGKVMMVKSLVIKSDETDCDFRTVPSNTTFAKGVELLKTEGARMQKQDAQKDAQAKKKEEPTRTAAIQASR
ncbi:MAG TPA: hypothetical protein VIY69_14530 [Candidatus Acidoferrales bacterium]